MHNNSIVLISRLRFVETKDFLRSQNCNLFPRYLDTQRKIESKKIVSSNISTER